MLDDHFDDKGCTPDDCTLREAMWFADFNPGRDTVTFAPGLKGTIFVDRSWQAYLGFFADPEGTEVIGSVGPDGTPLIQIDGTNVFHENGIEICGPNGTPGAGSNIKCNTANNVIRGLAVVNWLGSPGPGFLFGGIAINGSSGNTIENCYLGTEDGTTKQANNAGVSIFFLERVETPSEIT